ncbi:glycosyltransferase 87 family protein [Amycolatopsis jejuensis]|uniref:glycosyltransferase 87 family protein n=1 Tax=Amycolatopsis jejuensis TaxID=330084 RepID=UPI000527A01C|nr:glycosyltransferase 87 family protein [Amycolatopsis jejuensis]
MDIGTWLQAKAGWVRATRKRTLLFAAGATVIVAAVVAIVGSFGPVDLQVYRFGADSVLHGADPYAMRASTTSGTALPFIYPPFAAIVFMILAIPPLGVASVLLHLISVASVWIVLYVACRRLWNGWSVRTTLATATALTVVALVFEPVRSTIFFGQINLILMALVAVDCLAPNPRWPRGVLVGIAAAIKVTPAGFLLFFLLTKDFRAARNALIAGVGATALGFIVAPQASAAYFFGGGLTGAAGLSGSPYATNQTIEGALNRLDLPSSTHSLLWLSLSAFVLVAAVIAMRRIDGPRAFVVNAVVVLVLSPISWSHHWVWVAPAVLILASQVRTPRSAAALIAGAAVYIAAPHAFLPSAEMRELAWTPWQHLVGNAYLLVGIGFVAWQLFALQPARAAVPSIEKPAP